MRAAKLMMLVGLLVVAGCPDKQKKASIQASNDGFKALNDGMLDIALDNFNKAIGKDKNNHRAHLGKGQVYARRAQDEASGINGIKNENDRKSRLKMVAELWDKAVESSQEAVRLQKDNAAYQLQLGMSLYEAKKEKQAKTHLEETVKLQPDEKAYWYLGRIYAAEGEPKKAAEAWRQGCMVNPFFGPNFVRLGALYVRWDMPKLAIDVLKVGAKNVKGAEYLTNVYYYLGLAHRALNKNEDAIDAFKKSLKYMDSNREARFQLGFALSDKQDWKGATAAFKEFLKSKEGVSTFDRSQAQRAMAEAMAAMMTRQDNPLPDKKKKKKR